MDANSKPEVVWEGDQAFIAVDGVKVIKYSEHGSTAAEAGWRIERVTLQDADAFWPALQLSYNDEPLNWHRQGRAATHNPGWDSQPSGVEKCGVPPDIELTQISRNGRTNDTHLCFGGGRQA